MLLFGDVDPAASEARFEFGKDGKPFFIAGPRDTPARCKQILTTLANTCGPDGFHYLIPVSPFEMEDYLPAGLRRDNLRLIGPDGDVDLQGREGADEDEG